MTTTIKGLTATQRNGTIEIRGGRVVRVYQLEAIVIASSDTVGPIAVRNTTGLGYVGLTTYSHASESDPAALLKRKRVRQDSAVPTKWLVTLDYDTEPVSIQNGNEQTPQVGTSKPPKFRWLTEYADELFDRDFSSPPKPVTNPLGMPFDPAPTRPVPVSILEAEWYATTFTRAFKKMYEGHANSDTFMGAPAGSVVVTDLTGETETEDGTTLWLVRIRYRFFDDAENSADVEYLNNGTHYYTGEATWDGDEEELSAFLRDNVPYVGLLDADGKKVAPGDETYSAFRRYPRVSFAGLPAMA